MPINFSCSIMKYITEMEDKDYGNLLVMNMMVHVFSDISDKDLKQ